VAHTPHTFMINGSGTYEFTYQPPDWQDYYRLVRWGLCSALMGDAFYYYDDGNGVWGFHYFPQLQYDDFDTKLGYPTGTPVTLANGVFVRYFDNGAVLLNVSGVPVTVTDAQLQGGPFYRYRGAQDPVQNDGSLFSSISLWSGTGVSRDKTSYVGDGIILMKQPTTVVSDILIDNSEWNTTSPGQNMISFTGLGWVAESKSVGGNPVYAIMENAGYGNGVSFHSVNAGSGANQALYTPQITIPSFYEVFEWHGWYGNSAADVQEGTNVPVTISHAGGTTNLTVDQSIRYGQWNSLGTYYFNAGNTHSIKITDNANGKVLADAIKLVYRHNAVISGIIRDAGLGLVIPGAEVALSLGTTVLKKVKTDTQGKYLIDVEKGNYSVAVKKSSYNPASANLSIVNSNDSLQQNFNLTPIGSQVPLISKINVLPGASIGNVNIVWETDLPTKGTVAYGRDTLYGTTTPLEANFLFLHSVNLALSIQITYHFKITVNSQNNLTAKSSDKSFSISQTGEIFFGDQNPQITVIVDDGDGAPTFTNTGGNWEVVDYIGGSFNGKTNRCFRAEDSGPKAFWRPDLPVAGQYEVLVYYGDGYGGWAPDAQYTVFHKNGSTNFTLNQNQNEGKFNSLGIFDFDAGSAGYVQMLAKSSCTNSCYVVADAVMFQTPQPVGINSLSNTSLNPRLLNLTPNPFSSSTTISYSVPEVGKPIQVSLAVYNIEGKEVRKLVNELLRSGQYAVQWDGKGENNQLLGGGIYLVKMKTDKLVENAKMVLMK